MDTTFTFRVDAKLKAAFESACKALDMSGSQLLRAHMRAVVAQARQIQAAPAVQVAEDRAPGQAAQAASPAVHTASTSPPDTSAEQPGPLLTNTRAEREWLWIVTQAGEERAKAALGQLGKRRPYPVNVAQVLGLVLPAEHDLPHTAASQAAAASALERMVSVRRQMRDSAQGQSR